MKIVSLDLRNKMTIPINNKFRKGNFLKKNCIDKPWIGLLLKHKMSSNIHFSKVPSDILKIDVESVGVRHH